MNNFPSLFICKLILPKNTLTTEYVFRQGRLSTVPMSKLFGSLWRLCSFQLLFGNSFNKFYAAYPFNSCNF